MENFTTLTEDEYYKISKTTDLINLIRIKLFSEHGLTDWVGTAFLKNISDGKNLEEKIKEYVSFNYPSVKCYATEFYCIKNN